jgi:hypothetical protein
MTEFRRSRTARPVALMVSDSDMKQSGSNPKRRRVRRRFYIVPLALIAMLLTAAAISAYLEGPCFPVGSFSGVRFDLRALTPYAVASGPLRVRTCAGSYCTRRTLSEGRRNWKVWMYDSALSSEPVTVRLNVKDEAGNPVFDSRALVRLEPQPNIGDCDPPPYYVASVVATPAGELVQQS